MLGFSLGDLPWSSDQGGTQSSEANSQHHDGAANPEKSARRIRKERDHALTKLVSSSNELRLNQVEELCAKQSDLIARLQEDFQQMSLYSAAPGAEVDESEVQGLVARSLLAVTDEISKLSADVRRMEQARSEFSNLAADVRCLQDAQSQFSSLSIDLQGVRSDLQGLQAAQSASSGEIKKLQAGSFSGVDVLSRGHQSSDNLVQRDEFDFSLAQSSTLRTDLTELRSFVEKGLEAISRKYVEEISDLKHNVQHLRDTQEYTAVKSGFLALAASDCSHEEKEALFKALQEKESKLVRQGTCSESLNHPVASPMELLSQMTGAECEVVLTFNRATGDNLGASVVPDADGHTVSIERIFEGFLKDWNHANPAIKIVPGNKIVAVNGIRDDPGRMIQELSDLKMHKIVIRRASVR